jgi:hypothetical protein
MSPLLRKYNQEEYEIHLQFGRGSKKFLLFMDYGH